MIFVQGTMNMEPACIVEFQSDVADMLEKIRAEDGCLHYSILLEDASTGLVQVVEQWRDDNALHVHFTMPWVSSFFAKYGPKMQASTVQIFDIAGSPRPLPDM